MSEKSLADLLAPFKAQETAESAVLLLDDRDAQKLAAHWPFNGFTWNKPKTEMPEDLTRLWYWLWDGMVNDDHALAVSAGVPINLVQTKMHVLKCNRLIYPDHTVSRWASKILQAEVALRYEPRRR